MAAIYWETLMFMLLICVSGQTTLKTTNSACEDGWFYHDKYCYLIRDEYETFESARATCYMFGGNLPYGYHQSSLDFLIKTVKSKNTYGWWYGAKITSYDNKMKIERIGQDTLTLPATVPRPKTKELKPPTSGCVGLLVDPDTYSLNYNMISVPCAVTLPYACRGVPSSLEQSIRADNNHTIVPDIFDAYWFSDPLDKRSYADAQKSCIEKSMTLISIKDVDAAKNISGEFRRRQQGSVDPWWIGLSVTAGAYSWQAPGVALIPDVLVWSRHENTYLTPSCRILLNDGTIDARSCYEAKAPFMCQRYEQASGTFGCPLHWYRAGQSCYHTTSNNNYLTHDDAQAMCAKTNSHIVSVDTLEELIWLKNSEAMENANRVWTSLNDKATLNTFVWADGSKYDSNLVKWSKGDYMDELQWKCFRIRPYDLTIGRNLCEDNLNPGCQYKSTTGNCVSKNWKYLNNNCYFVKDYIYNYGMGTPYNVMLQKCYADAMKYDSSIEISPLKVDSKAVLNLYKSDVYAEIWIGLSETEKDVFVWADGTNADMSLFDQSASRKNNSTLRCATMDSAGLFYLETCKSLTENTLCEKEIPYHH